MDAAYGSAHLQSEEEAFVWSAIQTNDSSMWACVESVWGAFWV